MSFTRIGIAYDLEGGDCGDELDGSNVVNDRVEHDPLETVNAVEEALEQLGMEAERIGDARHLSVRLAQGDRWDMVFNTGVGVGGYASASLVPALLHSYQVPHAFGDPLTLAVSLHKGVAKALVRSYGIPTADFVIIERVEDAAGVDLPMPLFAKPISETESRGISRWSQIIDRRRLVATCVELLERYKQPVLVETFLPGREFAVGVLGTGVDARAIGVLEMRFSTCRCRYCDYESKHSAGGAPRRAIATDGCAKEAEQVALAAYRVLGCRDAGRIDIRLDSPGNPCFLEAEALPDLHPNGDLAILCKLLDFPYVTLIETIVESVWRRSPAPERTQDSESALNAQSAQSATVERANPLPEDIDIEADFVEDTRKESFVAA